MAILDKIRKKQQKAVETPSVVGGQTEAAARLMSAKSGKAGAPKAPISTELERAVGAETKPQLSQIQQAGALASAKAGIQQDAQQQQADRQKTGLGLESREVELKRAEQLANLSQKVEQEAAKLGLSKEAAAAEARLFQRRLGDQQYIQNLQQEATLNRLQDNANFTKAMAESQFGHDVSNMLLSEKYADKMTDNKLSWDEKMAGMQIEDFLDLAEANANAANQAQMWQGIAGVVGAGGSYAADKYGTETETNKDTSDWDMKT